MLALGANMVHNLSLFLTISEQIFLNGAMCAVFPSVLYFSAMPSRLHLGAGWLVWLSTALSPSPGAFTCSLRGISSWHLKDCLIHTQWQSSVPLLTSVWAH